MKRYVQAAFLVIVGCLQMTGDVLGMPALKAAGSITHASPAPKVFTSQSGYETYSAGFVLRAWDAGGKAMEVRLTPKVNANVRGPYNRRNAYGAAISYGPVLASSALTKPMFESVFVYAFCHKGGVAEEVGLAGKRFYSVEVVPLAESRARVAADWPTRFTVDCHTEIVAVAEVDHHG